MADVIIAGAGPVGLFLARELRLAGVQVVVLEAQKARSPHSKALTMNCRSVELLDMRGIAERFLREGVPLPSAHFAALDTRLELGGLDTRHPYTLVLAQARSEELLEESARELGVELRFGHRFAGFAEDDDGVTLDIVDSDAPTTTYQERARFVVGCDGARSAVRAAAEIGFPGTDATMTAFQGDVRMSGGPGMSSIRNENGGLLIVKQANGVHRVVVVDSERMHVDRNVAPTTDELRTSLVRIAGSDLGLQEVLWLSRFGNATRQAETYRRGRVMLAGDAAHIHFPAGGQGMNVGLQDAVNLGWKLGATVHGWAPPGLLDSYHRERHPVGAALLANTRAQEGLMGFTPPSFALRVLMDDLLRIAPLNRRLAEDVIGLSVAYPPDPALGAHPLLGRRLPDLLLDVESGKSRAYEWLRSGRFVLFDLAADGSPRDALLASFGDRLEVVSGALGEPRTELEDVTAVLVRPDGHIGWVGTRGYSREQRDAALGVLCGAPALSAAAGARNNVAN